MVVEERSGSSPITSLHKLMDALIRNLRLALKLLRKDRGFSSAVLATLALCIGANAAVFSAVNAVVLRPLPFESPERLVNIYNNYPASGVLRAGVSAADFFYRREGIEAFEEVGGFQYGGSTIGEPGSPERVLHMWMTPSLLPTLGVEPILGRNFTEEEMEPEKARKVILGYEFWQERYAGAPEVLGRDLRIDGRPYTIVGVLPKRFRFLYQWDHRIYLPMPFTSTQRTLASLHSNALGMIARLKPGVPIETAREQVAAQSEVLNREWPVANGPQLMKDAGFFVTVEYLQTDLQSGIRPIFLLLWAGVAFVLLIGFVNIASLILARANTRAHELATRIALGADRKQLAGQIVAESAVLGLLGGVLGLAAAWLGIQVMKLLEIDGFPRGNEIALDGSVLLFTLAVAGGAALIFGAISLFRILRIESTAARHLQGIATTAGRRQAFVRRSLVTVQVATAFVLLIGAGLLGRSLWNVENVDPGFQVDSAFSGFISLPATRYPDDESRLRFIDRMLEEVRALPGVRNAAVTTRLPFLTVRSAELVVAEEQQITPGEVLVAPLRATAGPGYFETMGIPIVKGRAFTESDDRDHEQVVIVDEWLAERLWPGEDPIGRRLYYGLPEETWKEERFFRVVGVAGSVKYLDLAETGTVGAYYFTYRQLPMDWMVMAVRAESELGPLIETVQKAVLELDPELPYFFPTTIEERIRRSLLGRRTPAYLLTAYAALALFLAALGLYGVVSYSVSQRTREIGIRVAIGSSQAGIVRLIVGEGLKLLALGLLIGAVAILPLRSFIEELLYGVGPANPIVVAGVALLLAVSTIAACATPALRAARIDPVAALKYE